MTRRVFVDMDGVLADFEGHHITVFGYAADWKSNDWKSIPGFFAGIPPMEDMHDLWNYVQPYDPIVLTGLPRTNSGQAFEEKRKWLTAQLGEDVPMIACLSKEKRRFGRPGDVLIDDREEYAPLWRNMGGLWITHTSAHNSIMQLSEAGI